ncbi:hypothetical protein BC834DRAFT_344240 [Gloeopeniophorella convolvens]|nr:hypothetical protein BC834DRAFT_344240 [Gloeopeniophorella convolvens]
MSVPALPHALAGLRHSLPILVYDERTRTVWLNVRSSFVTVCGMVLSAPLYMRPGLFNSLGLPSPGRLIFAVPWITISSCRVSGAQRAPLSYAHSEQVRIYLPAWMSDQATQAERDLRGSTMCPYMRALAAAVRDAHHCRAAQRSAGNECWPVARARAARTQSVAEGVCERVARWSDAQVVGVAAWVRRRCGGRSRFTGTVRWFGQPPSVGVGEEARRPVQRRDWLEIASAQRRVEVGVGCAAL